VSFVLLITAALFVRSLRQAVNFDPGFDPHNLVTASLLTQGAKLNKQQGQQFYQQVLARIGGLPGVRAATLSVVVPISGGGQRRMAVFEEYQPKPNEDTELNTNVVGPDYFRTMEIPIVQGRDFDSQDRQDTPGVVIVNEELARRYFGRNAVGKRLRISSEGPFLNIVGVARTAKYRDLREDPLPFIYIPLAQEYQPDMTLLVRTAGEPAALLATLRKSIG
jgi:hypothetical protein